MIFNAASELAQSDRPVESVAGHELDTSPAVATRPNMSTIRDSVRKSQSAQATLMINRSKKAPPEVIQNGLVVLRVDDVDRGPTDPPNLLCLVLEHKKERQACRLGCAAGELATCFSRNSFELVKGNLEHPTVHPQKVGVRQALSELSVGGGQGMLKCNCMGKCETKRCNC